MTNMEWLVKIGQGSVANDLLASRIPPRIRDKNNKVNGKEEIYRIFTVNGKVNQFFVSDNKYGDGNILILDWLSRDYYDNLYKNETNIITNYEFDLIRRWVIYAEKQAYTLGHKIEDMHIMKMHNVTNQQMNRDTKEVVRCWKSDVTFLIVQYDNDEHRFFSVSIKNNTFMGLDFKKIYTLADLGIEREDFVND